VAENIIIKHIYHKRTHWRIAARRRYLLRTACVISVAKQTASVTLDQRHAEHHGGVAKLSGMAKISSGVA